MVRSDNEGQFANLAHGALWRALLRTRGGSFGNAGSRSLRRRLSERRLGWAGQQGRLRAAGPLSDATTDDGGRFVLIGATASDYKLFAFEDIDPNLIYDPTLMERFANRDLIEIEQAGSSTPRQTQQLQGIRTGVRSGVFAELFVGCCVHPQSHTRRRDAGYSSVTGFAWL